MLLDTRVVGWLISIAPATRGPLRSYAAKARRVRSWSSTMSVVRQPQFVKQCFQTEVGPPNPSHVLGTRLMIMNTRRAPQPRGGFRHL